MGLQSCSCLLLLLMMALVSTALEASNCTNKMSCVGQPDCDGCAEDEMVPDPQNCRGYYVCDGDDGYYDLPFECSDGQVFDINTRSCQEGDTCEPCSSSSRTCSYECPEAGTVSIPIFMDCHSYYECEEGSFTGSGTCPASTPFFDGTKCQTDETRCCHCHAYCYEEDVDHFIANPLDCQGYYLCTDVGTPTILGTCRDEEKFDSFLQSCSATAPCVTQCTNVVGADGCIEPFTCTTTGFFPRCPSQCTPDYYQCKEVTNEYQDYDTCSSGAVFHPNHHTCVSPDQCP